LDTTGGSVSFTTVTITSAETRPNGEAAQGTIAATLSEPITNGATTIDPTSILGELNSEGKLKAQSGAAFTLVANDDTGTTPEGSEYTFLIEIADAPVRSFKAIVPHTATEGKITLAELEEM
jgi:hypothetical protein